MTELGLELATLGSGVSGADLKATVTPLSPLRYLINSPLIDDTNLCPADDVRSGCMEEAGPAGVDSTLMFENADNMMELPIIKYDQKQVGNKFRIE